jgi:hypothetical protein
MNSSLYSRLVIIDVEHDCRRRLAAVVVIILVIIIHQQSRHLSVVGLQVDLAALGNDEIDGRACVGHALREHVKPLKPDLDNWCVVLLRLGWEWREDEGLCFVSYLLDVRGQGGRCSPQVLHC